MYGFEEFFKLLHSFAELVFLLNLFLSHFLRATKTHFS